MVGRDSELAQLLEGWHQTLAGEGQMILVTGEAGIGKSCLLRALNDALDDESYYRIHYQCSPYHTDSALYPVLQQLARAAGFDIGDNDNTRLDKLETLLKLSPDESRQSLQLIADHLGIDVSQRYGVIKLTPQQQRSLTLQVLVAQLTSLAHDKPVLLIVEDVHWIDPTTLELIELMLDVLSQSKILLLMDCTTDIRASLWGSSVVYPVGAESACGVNRCWQSSNA